MNKLLLGINQITLSDTEVEIPSLSNVVLKTTENNSQYNVLVQSPIESDHNKIYGQNAFAYGTKNFAGSYGILAHIVESTLISGSSEMANGWPLYYIKLSVNLNPTADQSKY